MRARRHFKIAVSIPRLLLAMVLVLGIVAAGTQYNTVPATRALQPHTASLTQPVAASTLQPSGVKTTPVVTPAPAPPAPQPVATASIRRSATPVPVVTPAPNASVSGLTPVDPTPASASSPDPAPADSGSSTTGSSGDGTPPASAPPATTTGYLSTNWSGYLAAAPNADYTAVSGSWTVPTATATGNRSAYDAAWIGIGGVSTSDLIQAGTMDTVSHGHETASAFYEILPQSAVTISGLIVAPGDVMSAAITETSAGHWRITITDATSATSDSTDLTYTSAHSSADWIEEDPSQSIGTFTTQLPLDNFAPVQFTGGNTTNGGNGLTLTSATALPVTLVAAHTNTILATPSALGSDGQSFSVTHS